MYEISRLGILFALSNLLVGCSVATVSAIGTNSVFFDSARLNSTLRQDVDLCNRQLFQPGTLGAPELDSARIELLNWNIKKGQMSDWQADLELLGEGKQLVLIQEATQLMGEIITLPSASIWNFAPGHASRRYISGVATASQIEPLSICKLTAYEPWSRTAKATSITKFALSNSDLTLLVVNTHLINFTLGLKEYGYQLSAIREVLREHEGPAIVSGDFNTWRLGRNRLLEDLVAELNFEKIVFEEDDRLRVFGSTLDHIFVIGVSVLQAETHDVSSSDHNPMTLSMSVDI